MTTTAAYVGEACRLYVMVALAAAVVGKSMAMDDFRLAWTRSGLKPSSPLQVTHIWKQNGQEQRRSEQIPAGSVLASYRIDIPDGVAVDNEAIVFETPGQEELR